MSLYHEAAQILTTATENGGSLKSIVFGKKDWKTDRRTLYALSTEAAKWSEILSEVIERSDLLKVEKQLTPVLSLVLTHDLLLAKKGVALPAKHGLHSTISRHKARLTSELTKARLRRGCSSLDALRDQVNGGVSSSYANGLSYVQPRWIRVNTLLTTLDQELSTTFSDYTKVSMLADITIASKDKRIYRDTNIPNLVAISGVQDMSSSAAYRDGRLIFQEKASCFPAYLLDPADIQGDVIDACAAPGNKTTHLAAIIGSVNPSKANGRHREIYACEKDAVRSETLAKMVKLAGAANLVTVRAKQDFLKLDPSAPIFKNVEALLLDPSCSGSGIVGRDEAKVTIHLPPRGTVKQPEQSRGKKRKRDQQPADLKLDTSTEVEAISEETASPTQDGEDVTKLAARLANLSSFQLRLLKHAMAFPSAKRITYSTCSLHKEENEYVVARALLSDVARDGGWRVLRREEQVEGMRAWALRGCAQAVREAVGNHEMSAEEVSEACIRCEKGGDGGTMGFFVAAFVLEDVVRGVNGTAAGQRERSHNDRQDESAAEDDDEEWEGFSDG